MPGGITYPSGLVPLMRILFLHYAFPGPFRYLAESFAALPENVVLFASEYGRRDLFIPGVRRMELGTPKMKVIQGPQSPLRDAGRDLQMAYLRGNMTAQALRRLKRAGFIPDMICATAVMGNSLFLRDIFPDSFLVAHAESYAAGGVGPEGQVEPEGLGRTPHRVRNLLQVHGLVDCDLSVVSTEWQRNQFPLWLRKNMMVLRQCVDTDFFSPDSAGPAETESVTFSAHGLEAPPEWSRLVETIRALLAIRPACRIEVLAPGLGRETLAALREEAEQWGGGQVSLHGFSSPDFYRRTLRASSLYVHMASLPQLPAALLESMSCGCPVLAPGMGPIGEAIREGTGFACDFRSPAFTAGRIAELLDEGGLLRKTGEAARRFVAEGYGLAHIMPENRDRLLESYKGWLGARRRHVNHKKCMTLVRREG